MVCHVEVISSLFSEAGKAVGVWGTAPTPRLVIGWWSLGTGGFGKGIPFHWPVRKHFLLHPHSLVSRLIALIEVWPIQCPCDFLEPYVRVACRLLTSTVPHPNIHLDKAGSTASLKRYSHWQYIPSTTIQTIFCYFNRIGNWLCVNF